MIEYRSVRRTNGEEDRVFLATNPCECAVENKQDLTRSFEEERVVVLAARSLGNRYLVSQLGVDVHLSGKQAWVLQ